jgi:hypothetical protein
LPPAMPPATLPVAENKTLHTEYSLIAETPPNLPNPAQHIFTGALLKVLYRCASTQKITNTDERQAPKGRYAIGRDVSPCYEDIPPQTPNREAVHIATRANALATVGHRFAVHGFVYAIQGFRRYATSPLPMVCRPFGAWRLPVPSRLRVLQVGFFRHG